MKIGTLLRQLRKEKGFTQKQLADYLGLSERAYQHYESDTREPPLSNAVKLADFFDVSLDYLVGRSQHPAVIDDKILQGAGIV